MEISAYICSWDKMTEVWKKQGPDIYLGEFIDEEAGWIKEDSFTSNNDSMIFNTELGELFEKVRPSLPSVTVDGCEELLVAFCPGLESDRFSTPQSLGTSSEVIFSSLDPELVRKYATLAQELDINLVAMEIGKQATIDGNDVVSSSEDAAAFFEMWKNALNEAAQQNWGMLVHWG